MKTFSKISGILMLALTVLVTPSCEDTIDIFPPVITLDGDLEVFVRLGDAYTEPGAVATDDDGTDLTISVDDTAVNTEAVGTYEVLYSATDEAGNTATDVRTVHVFALEEDYAGTYTVQSEACDDGSGFIYDVEIQTTSTSGTVLLINLGDFSVEANVEMTLGGNTGGELAINDTDGGVTFTGTGTLNSMELTGGVEPTVNLTLNWTFDDGVNPAVACETVLAK